MLKVAQKEITNGSGHETAYTLLKEIYRQETGKPLPPIARTQKGKPYFLEGDYHFSISHTKNHAFCALSDRPIGIDAEEKDRDINPKLAEKILSPGEYAQYKTTDDPKRALLTFWVLKEAGAKCTGDGIIGYPNRTNYDLYDPRVQERDNCLVAVITEE